MFSFYLLVFIFSLPLPSYKKQNDMNEYKQNSFQQNVEKVNEKIQVRHLPLEGAYNVRDLGGYKTKEGKIVKWGRVFRSGDLNHLTENDLKYLSEIPLKTYIDFRDSSEIEMAPDEKPETLIHAYNLPITAGNLIDISKITAETIPTLLVDVNKSFVKDWQNPYTGFFKILMDEKKAPLLFHCSAGKDRTGYAAALFLASLGVDRKTIVDDYMLSAVYMKDKYAQIIKAYPIYEPLLTVKKEYIEGALGMIDEDFGGIETYLTKYLHVDLNKMKQLYLE